MKVWYVEVRVNSCHFFQRVKYMYGVYDTEGIKLHEANLSAMSPALRVEEIHHKFHYHPTADIQ